MTLPELHPDRSWQLLCPELNIDPQASIGAETDLLHQVGHGMIPPTIALIRHPRCLVVTRREARMPNFDRAGTELAAAGWPVVVRASGGSCVPQGPGMLNLTLVFPRLKSWSLEDGYQLLCDLLGELLRSYGIEAETGEVPGSFCDGRYNLQVGRKKLVGTAQRWAGGDRAHAATLLHACLLVDLDLELATKRLNQLYQLCDNPQRFNTNACTTLAQHVRPPAAENLLTDAEERLRHLLHRHFKII